jgi:hypothetical protein
MVTSSFYDNSKFNPFTKRKQLGPMGENQEVRKIEYQEIISKVFWVTMISLAGLLI